LFFAHFDASAACFCVQLLLLPVWPPSNQWAPASPIANLSSKTHLCEPFAAHQAIQAASLSWPFSLLFSPRTPSAFSGNSPALGGAALALANIPQASEYTQDQSLAGQPGCPA
jgi:hypothetical protein